ncbi:MAG TPA: hypothetical protein VFM55_06400 [Micromonosporaceae bacterium]|nr:hypothetical protein [Micromonosporaceae bacterium]
MVDEPVASSDLPDVSAVRLIDLLHSQDAGLKAAVEQLAPLLDRTAEIRLGWQSAVDVE